MTFEEKLREHEYMWTTHKDDYALVPWRKQPDGIDDYVIVKHTTNVAPIIEDERLAQEIIKRMLAADVFVGDPDTFEFKKARIRERLSQYKSGAIMVDKGRLNALEYMWTTRKDDFSLVRAGRNEDGPTQYTIEERSSNRVVFFENDDLAHEVERRMVMAGVAVREPETPARREGR